MAPKKQKTGEESVVNIVKKSVKDMFQDADTLQAIANIVEKTVATEVQKLVDSHVKAINDLKSVIEQRDHIIETLRNKVDELEQYQRRPCLRIFGVEERDQENTDDIAVEVAQKIGVQLTTNDIDRSHRVGRRQGDRPRPIIIKFSSYRKRSEVFRNKRQLKSTGLTIREDLTKVRYNLLRDAIAKFGVTHVWTQDGVIFVKQGDSKKRVTCASDLNNLESSV